MKSFLFVLSVTVFLLTGCGKDDSIDSDLRGNWVSNDASVYSGELVIGYGRITISGYGERQTPLNGDDANRPFRTFTKEVTLDCKSENGKIYIKDVGQWQDGIPYIYYTGSSKRDKFLRINFGGRDETLRRTN